MIVYPNRSYDNSVMYFQDEMQLKAKEKEIDKKEEALQKVAEKSKADEEAIAAAQKHYHAVSAGLSSNADGEDKTLADQLMGKICLFYARSKRKQYFRHVIDCTTVSCINFLCMDNFLWTM